MKKNIFLLLTFILLLSLSACSNNQKRVAVYIQATEAYALGNLEQTLQIIQSSKSPKRFFPLAMLEAKTLFYLGRTEESEKKFRSLMRKYPQSQDALQWYARALMQNGKLAQAEQLMIVSSQFNPGDWRIHYLLAQNAARREEHQHTLESLGTAEIYIREGFKVYMELGNFWYGLGLTDRAQPYLKMAELLAGDSVFTVK